MPKGRVAIGLPFPLVIPDEVRLHSLFSNLQSYVYVFCLSGLTCLRQYADQQDHEANDQGDKADG